MLPKDFQPSEKEVIIGRGRKISDHNVMFRELIGRYQEEYQFATTKNLKSKILGHVVDEVVANSPLAGGFVKFDAKENRWFTVDDAVKRTTTAQHFRDSLCSSYRSSKQFKQTRRRLAKEASTSTCSKTGDVVGVPTRATSMISLAPSASSHRSTMPCGEPQCGLAVPSVVSYTRTCSSSHYYGTTSILLDTIQKSLDLLDYCPLSTTSARTIEPDELSMIFSRLADQVIMECDIDDDPFEPTPLAEDTLHQGNDFDGQFSLRSIFGQSYHVHS